MKILRARLRSQLQLSAGCDLWASCLRLTGPGQVKFGPGCILERSLFPLILDLGEGARVEFGERVWLRGKYRPNILTAFDHACISIGPDSFLNGAIISARSKVSIGRRAFISWDVTILDSHLHALENDVPLESAPVVIGDYVQIGAGAIILPGAKVGSHVVIGAGAVVSGEVPDHVIAAGVPARVLRSIRERDRVI